METTNEYRAIQTAVSRYEALGAYRLTITATIADTLKAIDGQRKAARELTAEALKQCPDVTAATTLANMLCPSASPTVEIRADDATRKRLQRRRAFLVNVLSSTFPAYDFEVKKAGRNGGYIAAVYIGDAATREASSMLATLDRLFNLLEGEKPEVSRDRLAAAIRAEKAGCYTMSDPLADTNKTAYQAVKAEFAGMVDHGVTAADTAASKEETASKQAAADNKAAAVATAAAAAADNYTAVLDELNAPTTKAGKKAATRLEKAVAVEQAAALAG